MYIGCCYQVETDVRYYYTPHTILQLLRVACEPSADHVVVVVMFTCFHIYLLSVRTLCDPLYLPTLILREACNQGKKVEDFYSGDVTRRHSLGECVLTTLLKSTFKKKELPYESFSTFLCPTLGRVFASPCGS